MNGSYDSASEEERVEFLTGTVRNIVDQQSQHHTH